MSCCVTIGDSSVVSCLSLFAGHTAQFRQFLDKLLKDGNATFQAHHAERFIAALLEFQDPVDLLYRLTSAKVCVHSRVALALIGTTTIQLMHALDVTKMDATRYDLSLRSVILEKHHRSDTCALFPGSMGNDGGTHVSQGSCMLQRVQDARVCSCVCPVVTMCLAFYSYAGCCTNVLDISHLSERIRIRCLVSNYTDYSWYSVWLRSIYERI